MEAQNLSEIFNGAHHLNVSDPSRWIVFEEPDIPFRNIVRDLPGDLSPEDVRQAWFDTYGQFKSEVGEKASFWEEATDVIAGQLRTKHEKYAHILYAIYPWWVEKLGTGNRPINTRRQTLFFIEKMGRTDPQFIVYDFQWHTIKEWLSESPPEEFGIWWSHLGGGKLVGGTQIQNLIESWVAQVCERTQVDGREKAGIHIVPWADRRPAI